jgi:heme o synthase
MNDPDVEPSVFGQSLTYVAETSSGRMVPVGKGTPGETPAITVHESRGVALARMHNYLVLAKPRIAVMVLLTVALGYALGSTGPTGWGMWHAVLGIGMTAVASGALNQWWERDTDARMGRTARRPLPSGTLSPTEALVFGGALGLCGTAYLALAVNPLTAILAAATLVIYTAVYTPMKRVNSLALVVGAIPGAMPPVLGWTASGRGLDAGAAGLFLILFFWQFPHFLAIATMYRDEYARAGLKMLPEGRLSKQVGWLGVAYALALVPISLQPTLCGLAGPVYAGCALVLGLGYLAASVRFARDESRLNARKLLLVSIAYLPALLSVLVADHVWG